MHLIFILYFCVVLLTRKIKDVYNQEIIEFYELRDILNEKCWNFERDSVAPEIQ